MQICHECGNRSDENFKFCPHCGKLAPESNKINVNISSDDVWETCEIYFVEDKKSFLRREYLFEATAIGSQGRYAAAWSEVLKPTFFHSPLIFEDGEVFPHIDNSQPVLDDLIKKLVNNGWQSIGRGEEWYSERFRRKVKKNVF